MTKPVPAIRVEMILYNNLICTKMLEKRMVYRSNPQTPSVSELCRRMGVHYSGEETTVRNLVGMKEPAQAANGDWKPLALLIAKTLECKPEELFAEGQRTGCPASHIHTALINYGQTARWQPL